MLELVFGESIAGSLQYAKSMKPRDRLNGPTAVIGGTQKERRALKKSRGWEGKSLSGDAQDVVPLTLLLDIGDLSDLDNGMENRRQVLRKMFDSFESVPDTLWHQNLRTLKRLDSAKRTGEPVRIWASLYDPGERCGVFYICHKLRKENIPLSIVSIPRGIIKADTLMRFRNSGDVPPELFGALAKREKIISPTRRNVYAAEWGELVHQNAPLRAIINGKVFGVPESFYDAFLQKNIPDEEFIAASVIGKTLSELPGVGDRWLFLRLCEMIQQGQLVEIKKPTKDHPYSGILCRNR